MRKSLLFCAVLLFAVGVVADDFYHINTEPFWDNSITDGYLAQAQVFEAPQPNASTLANWQFALAGRSDPGQVTFNIYQWSATGPVGNALYSQTLDWGTSNQVFNVTGIGLALTPGQLYGADIDLQGYDGQSAYFMYNQHGYSGFDGWFYNPAFGGWNDVHDTNQYFTADFSFAPEPSTLIMMGSSLLGIGVFRRFRL